MVKIKIKYHDAELIPIEKIKIGDWIDLRAAKTVVLEKGRFYKIPLGVSMQLPDDYEAHIVPRSSTFVNWGVIQTNGMGIIDNSYSGDDDIWMFPAFATKNAVIVKNDRICQFRIMKKMPPVEIETVDTLNGNNRGGFGSTGVK